jgi:hypothetical protein
MFGRLKDWRRVATRYDRSPTVFLSCLSCAILVMIAGFVNQDRSIIERVVRHCWSGTDILIEGDHQAGCRPQHLPAGAETRNLPARSVRIEWRVDVVAKITDRVVPVAGKIRTYPSPSFPRGKSSPNPPLIKSFARVAVRFVITCSPINNVSNPSAPK